MARYRLSQSAQSDIDAVLAWSHDTFGSAARRRYQGLIAAAIRDIASDPYRAGSRPRPDLDEGIRAWHLMLNRDRSRADHVRRPRHVLFYRLDDGIVVVGRVLHDAMDVARYTGTPDTWD